MTNKKYVMITISTVLLGIILVAGVTYAFFSASINSDKMSGKTGKIDIDYHIDNDIVEGKLIPTSDKTKGIHRTVKAKLKEGSLDSGINIYLEPTSIEGFTGSDILKWEVISTCNGSNRPKTGDFSNATINNPMKIIGSCPLTMEEQTFDIYIWLSEKAGTDVLGKTFSAKLYAESDQISAKF